MNLSGVKQVFSTYVEVILILRTLVIHMMSFLHVCGGDPDIKLGENHDFVVFSTYVEVILMSSSGLETIVSFLHVCGGDPN